MGLATSIIGAVGAKKAADTQAASANRATDVQLGMFNTMRGDERPFMDEGGAAASKLGDLLGTSGNTGADKYGSLAKSFSYQDYLDNQDPGYEFMRKQGENSLINRTSTTGSALGGSALKSLMGYNQDYAKTGYNDAFNRYQTQQGNIFQRLSYLATLGQNAAANTGMQGTATGANVGANLIGAGNAQAAGIVGGVNAINKGQENTASIASMFFKGGA